MCVCEREREGGREREGERETESGEGRDRLVEDVVKNLLVVYNRSLRNDTIM